MLRIPNAFNLRAADPIVLDTSIFLSLYSPILLEELAYEDFTASKLIILNGSPGSGKSSLLRLFETSTLVGLCKSQAKNRDFLLNHLVDLGVINDNKPIFFGLYIHCDSSLREIQNLNVNGANDKVLNTILDVRIVGSYIRSIRILNESFGLFDDVDNLRLLPLPANELPPSLFAKEQTIESLENSCRQIEKDFAAFLNSFPGELLPKSIELHSKIFSFSYLHNLRREIEDLRDLTPIVMLDDLHELYREQREKINEELRVRSGIPRWIAIRKHVYPLEELISLDEIKAGRDFRSIDLDKSPPALFRKFVHNVADNRISLSSSLQPYRINIFEDQLDDALSATLSLQKIKEYHPDIDDKVQEFNSRLSSVESFIILKDVMTLEELAELEAKFILLERHRNKRQLSLFEDFVEEREVDYKVKQAAQLFSKKRYKIPYYFSFDVLALLANSNIEQFLSIASVFVDKMILRVELNREVPLKPSDQENLIKRSADNYFKQMEQGFQSGYTIKQLVENLGLFFNAVSYRPNAPFAPGVNGFGFEKRSLKSFLDSAKSNEEVALFQEILKKAVAHNVFFVHTEVKQGKVGSEKVVFYLNRLLCVLYNLPLSTGGWQQMNPELIVRMMKGPVSPKDWNKSWVKTLLEED
jgi:hypothetical protein